MNNLKIMVTNPYYEKEYIALDVPLSHWIGFLENNRHGNEKCFCFLDISGTHVVVNPENFASIEVVEVTE